MFTSLIKNLFVIILVTFCATACIIERRTTVVHSKPAPVKPMPPGQAKKVAGTQSAKPFAPGQQKKKK